MVGRTLKPCCYHYSIHSERRSQGNDDHSFPEGTGGHITSRVKMVCEQAYGLSQACDQILIMALP